MHAHTHTHTMLTHTHAHVHTQELPRSMRLMFIPSSFHSFHLSPSLYFWLSWTITPMPRQLRGVTSQAPWLSSPSYMPWGCMWLCTHLHLLLLPLTIHPAARCSQCIIYLKEILCIKLCLPQLALMSFKFSDSSSHLLELRYHAGCTVGLDMVQWTLTLNVCGAIVLCLGT